MVFREVTLNTETVGANCEQNKSSFVDSINKTLCSFNYTATSHVSTLCEQDLNELRESVHELSPCSQNKLLTLVGEKCIVEVIIEGQDYNALWDTGAQFSLFSNGWVEQNVPEKQLRALGELVTSDLTIKCANESIIPFVGWIDLSVQVKDQNVRVPFLVCDMHLEHPIVGYNVIIYFEIEDVLLSMMIAMDSSVIRTVAEVL